MSPLHWTVWYSLASSSLSLPVMEVPFGCDRTFVVSQANNQGNHTHRDRHAWDFRMPEGTPVTAARDGLVRLARGDSKKGGCDRRFARDANFVVLSHDGGIETQYLHLSKVVVKAGMAVRAGQLLGFSGKTGWACGPHLHFKVASQASSTWNNFSVPATFKGHPEVPTGTRVSSGKCE